MKKGSTYIIGELQIKTTRRKQYTPMRMAKTEKTDDTNCWRGCGATGTLVHCWWECKTVQPLWKAVWRLLTKLNILSPYDPAIALLGPYPKGLKTYVHMKTCIWMFIAALFIIAKTWKQPRCPSAGEWTNCGTSKRWNVIHC